MATGRAVRRLGAADAPECARLHAQAFHLAWSEEDFHEQAGRQDRVLHGIALRKPVLAGQILAGQIVAGRALAGMVVSRFVGDEADLLTLVVDRSARRAGHGAQLLTHHLQALADDGVKTVFLEVVTTNCAARALYAAAGFKPVGTRRGYYPGGGPATDALVLRCDL